MSVADALRLVDQVLLTVNAAIILVIVRRWVTTVPKDARRLLFRHVVELGVGVLTLEVVAFAFVTNHVGRTIVWYGVPFVTVASLALLVGLVDMLRWLSRKRPKPIPSGLNRRHTDRKAP